ncbi:hypothetical protein Hdeb2414_s0007g00240661 [Helianthus debilis subsp. tardiflorus]
MKNAFAEEKTVFEAEKNSEEWGREGLKSKLQAAEELLSKERAEWKKVELNALVANKDKDLAVKDVEIKNAEEARDISTSALNVAQNNYAEAQRIFDTLVSESEWMRSRGVAAISNSILNATELDEAVAALIDASRAVGHRGGYLECAQHVEEAFGQQFDTHHCSVTDQADSMLSRAEEVYDHLSLPVMELVIDALKHDDSSARLKSIIDPLETVELTDEEGEAGGDGDGHEEVIGFIG